MVLYCVFLWAGFTKSHARNNLQENIYMDFPRLSMDIHVYPRMSVAINGYAWKSMDIHGYPSASMDIHGYPWTTQRLTESFLSPNGTSFELRGFQPYQYRYLFGACPSQFQDFQFVVLFVWICIVGNFILGASGRTQGTPRGPPSIS